MLIILAALVVAAGAYWYFFSGSSSESPLSIDVPENAVQTQFRSLTSKLQPISFDTSIFLDPRFNALVDLTTPISIEPSGRSDPFAVFAGASGT